MVGNSGVLLTCTPITCQQLCPQAQADMVGRHEQWNQVFIVLFQMGQNREQWMAKNLYYRVGRVQGKIQWTQLQGQEGAASPEGCLSSQSKSRSWGSPGSTDRQAWKEAGCRAATGSQDCVHKAQSHIRETRRAFPGVGCDASGPPWKPFSFLGFPHPPGLFSTQSHHSWASCSRKATLPFPPRQQAKMKKNS